MGSVAVRENGYVGRWLRPAALVFSSAAHTMMLIWDLQPASTEAVQPPLSADLVMMTFEAELPPPAPVAPNPVKASPAAKPIPLKPVDVGSAAGDRDRAPQPPAQDGWSPDTGLRVEIKPPVLGSGAKDVADALWNWCTAPARQTMESAPAAVKPTSTVLEADSVVVNCGCLISSVRPYQLTGEQMALFLALIDPGPARKRFQGLVVSYRSKYGQGKTKRLLDTLAELSAKLDLCAVDANGRA